MISKAAQEIFEQRRQELAAHIIGHPDEFNMASWGQRTACGTTACLAGWAVLLAEKEGLCNVSWDRDHFMGPGERMHMTVRVGNEVKPLSTYAQEYLGLENWGLFYAIFADAPEAAKKLLDEPYSEGPFETPFLAPPSS